MRASEITDSRSSTAKGLRGRHFPGLHRSSILLEVLEVEGFGSVAPRGPSDVPPRPGCGDNTPHPLCQEICIPQAIMSLSALRIGVVSSSAPVSSGAPQVPTDSSEDAPDPSPERGRHGDEQRDGEPASNLDKEGHQH